MSRETVTITIAIGAICDPLHKQLKKQGVIISPSDITHYQKAVDGYLRLKILGCFGDKEGQRIAQRLVNKIVRFAETKSK